jgi:hypothetical protein
MRSKWLEQGVRNAGNGLNNGYSRMTPGTRKPYVSEFFRGH